MTLIDLSGIIEIDKVKYKYSYISREHNRYCKAYIYNKDNVPVAQHILPVNTVEGQTFVTGGHTYKVIKRARTTTDFTFKHH